MLGGVRYLKNVFYREIIPKNLSGLFFNSKELSPHFSQWVTGAKIVSEFFLLRRYYAGESYSFN